MGILSSAKMSSSSEVSDASISASLSYVNDWLMSILNILINKIELFMDLWIYKKLLVEIFEHRSFLNTDEAYIRRWCKARCSHLQVNCCRL